MNYVLFTSILPLLFYNGIDRIKGYSYECRLNQIESRMNRLYPRYDNSPLLPLAVNF